MPEITERFDIGLISIKWGGTPLTALDPKNEGDAKLLSLLLPNNQITFEPDVSLHITIPSEFQRIGKKSFGVSALTEASILPANMIEGLNRVDMTIVPSTFTKEIAVQSQLEKRDKTTNSVIEVIKVNTPLEVAFEGLDMEVFNKTPVTSELTSTLNTTIEESFAFLFCGHWMNANLGHDRKDVGMLVHTFLNTFKARKKKPALILKSSGAGFSITERDGVLDKIHQIQEMLKEQGYTGKFPNVYVLNGDLTDQEMNELYNHPKIGAMVSFTHGEGFGLPLLEFTATGKPVIAPNYSGQVDFLNPDYSVLLPGKMIKIDRSAQNEWITDSEWFQVNYQYAGQILADVYDNYNKYLIKSRKHPKYTKDNFSISKMGEVLLSILQKHGAFEQRTLKLPPLKKVS